MKHVIMIAGLLPLTSPIIAQLIQNKDNLLKIDCANREKIALNKIGYTRINFKDGTVKKGCLIKEIKPNWIVYLKDRVLHDEMIDKIKWIELEDKMSAIYFDEKNNPFIKKIE